MGDLKTGRIAVATIPEGKKTQWVGFNRENSWLFPSTLLVLVEFRAAGSVVELEHFMWRGGKTLEGWQS